MNRPQWNDGSRSSNGAPKEELKGESPTKEDSKEEEKEENLFIFLEKVQKYELPWENVRMRNWVVDSFSKSREQLRAKTKIRGEEGVLYYDFNGRFWMRLEKQGNHHLCLGTGEAMQVWIANSDMPRGQDHENNYSF